MAGWVLADLRGFAGELHARNFQPCKPRGNGEAEGSSRELRDTWPAMEEEDEEEAARADLAVAIRSVYSGLCLIEKASLRPAGRTERAEFESGRLRSISVAQYHFFDAFRALKPGAAGGRLELESKLEEGFAEASASRQRRLANEAAKEAARAAPLPSGWKSEDELSQMKM
jgi:hypothetical protein